MNGSSTWWLLTSGPQPAPENMAWDEALLLSASRLGTPLLRFYAWTQPAATFGYFQHYRDIEGMTVLRPLIRRPTGGGLVPHDADWTYSLIIPPTDPWYALSAVESYRQMHHWICAAFQHLGATTELAPTCRRKTIGQCFVGAEKFDVIQGERKIAGAAQRRTRDGLLIQGSIQPPPDINRRDYEPALLDQATKNWNVHWEILEPDQALITQMHKLCQEKYAQADYNTRR